MESLPDNFGKLLEVLNAVRQKNKESFAGLGIVLTSSIEGLPLYPIHGKKLAPNVFTLLDTLVEISKLSNSFHDGFHVISNKWEVVALSQFFSPPIPQDIAVDHSKKFGARYLAALFGSRLKGVDMIGIASPNFGVAIFQNGKEIFYKK